jgi:plasmid stabilization system protein ParE
MTAVLEFLPEAICDAEEATKYYEDCLEGLGVRFRAEVESLCAAILRQPLLWRECADGHRRVNFPGFPYYIAYFIRGKRIIVAAVGHAARHPDYWKQRQV